MFLKNHFFILFLCYFVHACNAQLFAAATTSIAHKEQLKYSMSLSNAEGNGDLCKKNRGSKGTKSGSEDHKALMLPPTKSEDSSLSSSSSLIWAHFNVREMDLHSSMLGEEDFSETTDYQPPRRKSPIHNK